MNNAQDHGGHGANLLCAKSNWRRERLCGRHVHSTAEAGGLDRNLRSRLRQVEPLFDQSRLDLFSATDQAFVQPVQRPEIIGMLAGAAQLAVKAEIGAVYRLGLIDPSLLDLPKGEHMTPQYGALNPNMRMPTLKDGDYVLWESNAICQYLASKKPESGLLPKDERARFDVTRWQFWDLAHWDPACAVFAYEYVVKPFVLRSGEPDMAAVAKGTEAFHRVGKVLDGQLKGKPFVTGDTLTVADFSLGAAMKLADIAHYPIEPYGEIKRWYGTLSALPAWQKTLAQTAMPAASAA